MAVTYTVGDTREVIKTIADGSVDLIATSPPFLALRSYVPADHHAKGDEIGSERNPAEFIDMLLGLTAEWGRVLAPHGSIAIELGDTYSGSGGGDAGLSFSAALRGEREKQGKTDPRDPAGWPRAKSLALIPQLYAIALAYGLNPLTGQPSPAGRWLVRNVIVWHRPNPAVGALGDKVRPSTSYIVIATRSPKRWFDLTAVRSPSAWQDDERHLRPDHKMNGRDVGLRNSAPNPAGAPPLDAWFDSETTDVVPFDHYDGTHDTWTLTTQPSRLAHYAMWPAKLAERLILSMCPREVCRVCGEPRRRIEKATDEYTAMRAIVGDFKGGRDRSGGLNGSTQQTSTLDHVRHADTIGWSDCGHDNYRPGLVLDPFAGSGTTLAVADLHGRDAIGIDFDARNKAIYPARYDEVKRALFGTQPEMPGQETFDFEVPA